MTGSAKEIRIAEFFRWSKGAGHFISLKANTLENGVSLCRHRLASAVCITLASLVTYIENRFCNW